MRPRHQEGAVERRGASWVLRFHEDRNVNGIVKRVRAQQRLAAASDYRNEHEVRRTCADRIAKLLRTVNTQSGSVESASLTLGEFIETRYFPRCEERVKFPAGNELHLEPSTIEGYRDIFKCHIRDHAVARRRLRDFNGQDGQDFLESLPQTLSHHTHLRVRAFLSGVFAYALESGAFVGANR